ncbi:MAG: esterase-like of phytase family protein, partial [Bradyrhizobium sp.]|nr:esterase-like of phytase family protein [Bradyrhizobium sp.]
AIAVSGDGASLFVAFQSPLAHPDRQAHEHGSHLRIWRLDAADGALIAEYAYPLDDPDSFRRDAAAGKVRRDDVKVSELVLLGDDTLLVLERISLSTKIYRVTLAPAFAIRRSFSDPASRPTLEQMSREDLIAAGVPLLDKTLILSTDDCLEICGDLEGMILLSPRALLLTNDSDFGIEGAATQFWRICFDEDIFAPARAPGHA